MDEYDREYLRVVGTAAPEDQDLPAATGCTHRALSSTFPALG